MRFFLTILNISRGGKQKTAESTLKRAIPVTHLLFVARQHWFGKLRISDTQSPGHNAGQVGRKHAKHGILNADQVPSDNIIESMNANGIF
jgi:hypothetical protein